MHKSKDMRGAALRTAIYTPAMSSEINPGTCPLCGQANQCAIVAGLPPASCWCMQAVIAAEALARIPTEQRGQACVCPSCGQVSPTGTPS